MSLIVEVIRSCHFVELVFSFDVSLVVHVSRLADILLFTRLALPRTLTVVLF